MSAMNAIRLKLFQGEDVRDLQEEVDLWIEASENLNVNFEIIWHEMTQTSDPENGTVVTIAIWHKHGIIYQRKAQDLEAGFLPAEPAAAPINPHRGSFLDREDDATEYLSSR